MPAENSRTCPTCATLIPASFPEGFCPKCLLGGSTPAASTAGVPSVEMLRRIFPDLEILDVLGTGGMGVVYKARQPRLNRLIALKVMVAAPGHEADFALRFEREAQVLARLSHPHIVIIYDFGDISPERTGADPLFYFLMEYVDGTDLGQLIKSGELKPAQSLVIVPQICDALQYAHDQGITHRDIKPANILIDQRGTVKIADFGLAKMAAGPEETLMTGLTQTGAAMGTPHYMAPEQWEHPDQVDHRADIYALGVVFYEMLTGERPAGVFQPPSKKSHPPVDRKLDEVVLRAMDKNPDLRYQQAGQIGDDITRISGAHKSRPATSTEPGSQRSFPKRLLALGALALLGLSGWWMQEGVSVTETPPASIIPGEWINLDPQVLEQGDAKPTTGGWLLLAKQGPQGGSIVLTKHIARNAGLRGRFHGSDFKDMKAPYLRLRASDSGGIQLHLDVENQVPTVWIKRYSTHDPNGADLLKRPLAVPFPLDREYTLELYLIGSQVIARCNQELFQVALDHESADSGQASIIEHLGPDRFRDLQFINLDGLSKAEALKLAGMLMPEAAAKPGRLRAAGTTANGQPHDLAKFAAHDDFVDVAGGWGRWVALRADGQTVSSDGRADLTGIRRIVCSFNGEYGFIDTHGNLRLRSDTRLTLPPALASAQVEDAALGSAHGLALLTDQTAVAFGSRYETTVDDPAQPKGYGTPRWPPPPEEALREVQAVAVASTHAATLRLDGTVTIWGWEGRVEWAAEPRLERVRQLVSSEDSLWLLDEAGQVWRLALPRNPAPDQPIFFDGRLKLIATDATAVRERCWRQRDGTWRSDSQKADTSLQNLRLPEGVALSVNIGTYDGKPFASLLWIEPAAPGGADGPATAVPPK